MNKPGKSKLFKASLLAALLTTSLSAQAAGLGKLTVYSAIGQPLNAEVALTATPEELSALSAKLASHDDFKKAGIEFMSALSGLRFSVAKQPDGQSVLKLTTDRPLNEPFLHFLVELNWTAGRLVREYTFLLDPPEMLQAARPASVVTPVIPQALPLMTAPATAAMPATPAKAMTEPRPARTAAPEPAAIKPKPRAAHATAPVAAMPSTGERQVRIGDTLSKIARENKPAAVSLDQMLVALFNSNREVFDGNNMNRLRAGKILQLPDPGEAAAVDAGEARKLIVAQTADFNAYRRSLAAAATMAPATETQSQQRAAGKIKPQVESKTPPVPTKDKLEVSPTEAAKSAKTAESVSKTALEEDLIARDKALREASGRIVELEKNLENLKHLVELRSQAGVQVQQQAQTTLPKPAEAKKPEAVPPPVAAAKPAEPVPSAASSAPVVEKAAEVVAPAPAPIESAKPAELAPAPVAPPAPPKPAVKKPAPPPLPPESSFIDDNPELVFGGGGLIALLLGYLGFSAYRRKKQAQEFTVQRDEPGAAARGLGSKSAAVIGAASESVDSGDVSIQGDFSESGVLTTAESVDPVAEADVYMAYGRDSQAEEILLEGLKTDPTRTAIHLKLLELYANRKSVPQFESVANELHGLTGGKGSDWDKAAKLAAALGVTGGLFAAASAATMADKAVPAAAMAAAGSAEPPASSVQTPAEEDAGTFDFDLDLGTSSGQSIAPEQVSKQAIHEEAAGLDFDFDLGSPTQNPPPDETTDTSSVDSNAIDFALDAGSSAEPPAIVPMSDASNEIDFDLDLGSAEETPATAAVEKPVAATSPAELDFNFDLELGSEEPTPSGAAESLAAATTAQSPAALDLPEISFDLGEPTPIDSASEQSLSAELPASSIDFPAADTVIGAPVAAPVSEAVTSAVSPETTSDAVVTETDDSEVATKLELALAYEEMGDREGARELLNEVLNEGSPTQQGQARARLEQMDL